MVDLDRRPIGAFRRVDRGRAVLALLGCCLSELDTGVDAVLGPAEDGGWWALGLHEPRHAALLADIPMSTPTPGS